MQTMTPIRPGSDEVSIRDLVDQAVAAGGRGATPFGLYLFAGTTPGAALGRAVERDVFLEYFGNTPEMLAAEYDRYDATSLFIVVIDHHRRVPAGVMRIIMPSPVGQKSLVDLEAGWGDPLTTVLERTDLEWDPTEVWDIATLAVAAEYRRATTDGLISLALYQALGSLMGRCGAKWFVAILDLIVLDLIQTRTGRPISNFDGIAPKSYLDSPSSLPVYSDWLDYEARVRITDPAMHEVVFLGTGLEAAVSMPAWDEDQVVDDHHTRPAAGDRWASTG